MSDTKIDSLKLFVPELSLDKERKELYTIQDKDYHRLGKFIIGSGEVLEEEFRKSKFAVNIPLPDGCIVSISETNSRGIGQGKTAKGLNISLNAKHLRTSYFDGLNHQNTPEAIRYILSKFTKLDISVEQVMKHSLVSDIDFCTDFIMNESQHSGAIEFLKASAIAANCNNYNEKRRQKLKTEFYFNDRKRSSEAKPFAKLYRKHPEYHNSEHQFSYFKNDVGAYRDISRWEVTIKNKAMMYRYSEGKCNSSTLDTLLSSDYSMIPENVYQKLTKDKKFSGLKRPELIDGILPDKLYSDLTPKELSDLGRLVSSIEASEKQFFSANGSLAYSEQDFNLVDVNLPEYGLGKDYSIINPFALANKQPQIFREEDLTPLERSCIYKYADSSVMFLQEKNKNRTRDRLIIKLFESYLAYRNRFLN